MAATRPVTMSAGISARPAWFRARMASQASRLAVPPARTLRSGRYFVMPAALRRRVRIERGLEHRAQRVLPGVQPIPVRRRGAACARDGEVDVLGERLDRL